MKTTNHKSTYGCLMLAFVCIVVVTSCQREIDFDYPTAVPAVIIEGQISNENVFVRINKTRPMMDNAAAQPIPDAEVWISCTDGTNEQLIYDSDEGCYLSATGLTAKAGKTYKMRATVEGRQYEATSTMQQTAVIDSVYFRYIKVLKERVYFYCVKGKDPIPDERNYYLCRLMRGDEIFRWNTRSGRSNVNGKFEYDMMCSTESAIDKGPNEDDDMPLAEGDTLALLLMTLDRESWEYFQSLNVSQRTTANPITNIKGGAQGVFAATNITRADPIVFRKKDAVMER